jgi:hypothetical protein
MRGRRHLIGPFFLVFVVCWVSWAGPSSWRLSGGDGRRVVVVLVVVVVVVVEPRCGGGGEVAVVEDKESNVEFWLENQHDHVIISDFELTLRIIFSNNSPPRHVQTRPPPPLS